MNAIIYTRTIKKFRKEALNRELSGNMNYFWEKYYFSITKAFIAIAMKNILLKL